MTTTCTIPEGVGDILANGVEIVGYLELYMA